MAVGRQIVRRDAAAIDEEIGVLRSQAEVTGVAEGEQRARCRASFKQALVHVETFDGGIGHVQAGVVEQRDEPVGMREIGGRLGHAREGVVERAAERIASEGVTAFEKVRENLAVIGRRTFVMHAVAEHLPGKFLAEQIYRRRTPAGAVRTREIGGSPGERLNVLHEMIAAEIGLEIAIEEGELAREAPLGGRARSRVDRIAATRQFLHPDDCAQRHGIAVPAVAPGAGPARIVGADPVVDDMRPVRLFETFEIFHVMQVHPPELVRRRQIGRAPVNSRPVHGDGPVEEGESPARAGAGRRQPPARREERLRGPVRTLRRQRTDRPRRPAVVETAARVELQAAHKFAQRHMPREGKSPRKTVEGGDRHAPDAPERASLIVVARRSRKRPASSARLKFARTNSPPRRLARATSS